MYNKIEDLWEISMNNDLIEAADNFDRHFLINNEKLFLYLIENKKNKTVILI